MRQVLIGLAMVLAWTVLAEPEPELAIPYVDKAPAIDGVLTDGEWDHMAAVSMFEAYPNGYPRAMRAEQVVFYVGWNDTTLFVAMECLDSNTNTIVGACSLHDSLRIIGDDCLELMVTPGHDQMLKQPELPVYYLALNSIGTVWDARFYPLLSEMHNSWESGAQIANRVDGTHWVLEMAVPFLSLVQKPPQDGDIWRMNFDRTYFGYQWNAWNARGGLNDARVGGNVTFRKGIPAVRLLNVEQLLAGQLQVRSEVTNGTGKPVSATLALEATGQTGPGEPTHVAGKDTQTVTLAPGEKKEVVLGKRQRLDFLNQVSLVATDADGKTLWAIHDREVRVPAPRMPKTVAPKVPMVYVFPRFYPTLDRLVTHIDYSAWTKKRGKAETPSATIRVWPKGQEAGKPVLEQTLTEFADNKGVARASTAALPDGEYTVKVTLTSGGEPMIDHDDWFIKQHFPWMDDYAGAEMKVLPLFEPMKLDGRTISLWGRTFQLAANLLPEQLVSQSKPLLAGPVTFEVNGKANVGKGNAGAPEKATPARIDLGSKLTGGPVPMQLSLQADFDGFLLYRLTYGPGKVDRLRVRIPLDARYCKFWSACGDPQGTNIAAAVLPTTQGTLYDSSRDTRSVICSPTFSNLFWVGDYDTYFCYAADSDRGWAIRDDAPAVQVERVGDQVVLWLNVIDRPIDVDQPRTAEFAFQVGPVKALPDNARALQDGGDPRDAPLTIIQDGGSGTGMSGGLCFMGPNLADPELQAKNRARLEKLIAGGGKAVVGYHQWGAIPKGVEATKVFRGEWGIDKYTWDAAKGYGNKWRWDNKFFGPDSDRYLLMHLNPTPSYLDYVSWMYNKALDLTPLNGFYDDLGTPKPAFDPELGLGFVRDDGRKVWSSGLWLYRERWRRAATITADHGRELFTRDSQHTLGHYQPAYGFIGIWGPCERGYYNPFPDRDNYGFYGSLERYYAYNPSRAFGQPGMIGMASSRTDAPGFIHDTASMMMLVFLHDQGTGSFGHRDTRVESMYRHARARFEPWEAGTTFTGWWQSGGLVTSDNKQVVVSLYQRPGRALFVVGNIADGPLDATLTPNWAKLGLDPAKTELVDAVTLARLPLEGGAVKLTGLASHEPRLVLAAAPGVYPPAPPPHGRDLPKPATLLTGLCDSFDAPVLAEAWTADLHEQTAGAWPLDGRLCVQGASYGYSHVRRPLNEDNVTVQCQIVTAPTGAMDTTAPSLYLVWPNGEDRLQATASLNRGKFLYMVNRRRYDGAAPPKEAIPGESPCRRFWVRIQLTPEAIVFSGSADGATWEPTKEIPRPKELAGAPAWIMLGNGQPGPKPFLCNVMSQHFYPQRRQPYAFFDDLIVGR